MSKSGFVAILGRTNVGKSTLLNAIFNRKLSIVADKAQTTRNNIKGIYTTEKGQAIFLDTPGIHKPQHKLGVEMNTMAYSAAHDVDVSILVVDASKPFDTGDDFLINHLDIHNTELIIAINKIDEAKINQVQALKDKYSELFPNAKLIELSAIEKFNVDLLLDTVFDLLPEGPLYYNEEEITDKDAIFQIKEIIREKALRTLRDEVPHSIAVYMDNIEWDEDPIEIQASIIVEKEGQKGIVIGAKGQRIKLIGSRARSDIENLLKKHVFLELRVRVQDDWRNQENMLKKFGYKIEKK